MEVAKDVINSKPLIMVADDERVFMLARLTGKRRGRS